jgi:hypothetical protein
LYSRTLPLQKLRLFASLLPSRKNFSSRMYQIFEAQGRISSNLKSSNTFLKMPENFPRLQRRAEPGGASQRLSLAAFRQFLPVEGVDRLV